eukprot:CAMPEP_0174300322 /NCGR_PEP_ID=MMETSP0809-20121228/58398_1 /TAXON_ID=73025 ORGANISM="Eutreptiella gymnastica-like, Strain CCMP1594" /NCGR_SAMPLE_ID=MMETSP0809 /ASSEMBLY_ACC=CAM_ASM_000658 /LENGTH=107 /DNA_ID=CAMNT_0015405883 /DNA_START=75 /DNA_END=398 /DNA_ORIENTATION=-
MGTGEREWAYRPIKKMVVLSTIAPLPRTQEPGAPNLSSENEVDSSAGALKPAHRHCSDGSNDRAKQAPVPALCAGCIGLSLPKVPPTPSLSSPSLGRPPHPSLPPGG